MGSPKVLIISQYSLPEHKRNMNAYQRVFYGAEHAEVSLLIRKKQSASQEIKKRAKVFKAPVENRWLFLVYCVAFAIVFRMKGYRIILTEPSGFAAVGWLIRFIAGYFWVMDLWDSPRRRSDSNNMSSRNRLSDMIAFRIMRHANMYVLSVLPQAAKDINPSPEKSLQLRNAIDLSSVASKPPERTSDDPVLQLGYSRSEFLPTMGLDVLIKAAEKLRIMECPVSINLFGSLGDQALEQIQKSPAASSFRVHGFVSIPLSGFLRHIHVGLVPFPPLADLSYVFPIKVLEHFSQGNPVIASRLPGLGTIIRHEYNGLLVEPGSAESLANAIAKLQQNIDLWKRLAWNALQSVKQYEAGEKNRKIFQAIFERFNGRNN